MVDEGSSFFNTKELSKVYGLTTPNIITSTVLSFVCT